MENLELSGASFWRGKRVVVTGHTGFKGSWLTLWLSQLGAEVTGIALPPATTPSLFTDADVGALCDSRICDIRDRVPFSDQLHAARPDIVFHLAAQPLVRASYREPLATFDTNVMGTAYLLDALRGIDSVRVAVLVTTDKVYRENARPHREDDALGGVDPYSASKAASEIVIASYRDAFLSARGVAVASARAGNVIGGGDWAEDRLIPDAVRAWQAGKVLDIRRPDAVRPWQHVLEPLGGYLTLARKLWERPSLAGAYNFGPDVKETASVRDLIELARRTFSEGKAVYGNGKEGPHETGWLALDNTRADTVLGVAPIYDLAQAVERTMAWYRDRASGATARALCLADIAAFEARRAGVPIQRVVAG